MTQPLAPNFDFWTPPATYTVHAGAEQAEIELPAIPLPIKKELHEVDPPSDDAIGNSLYDYLRQFPDCPHNRAYAVILRDAYPHFLADLGAQIVMLDHKDVEAPYVKRKIVSLQILLLLDPDNTGLLQQLGINLYELGLMFPELPQIRRHFIRAMRYLAAAGEDATSLNYLARIDYLMGDLPQAIRRWKRLAELIDDPDTRAALAAQIETVVAMGEPEKSLLDDLEAIGLAMQLMAENDIESALTILERLERENIIPAQFPNPEFYYMLGVCRERSGDLDGACGSFAEALQLDPGHQPSLDGLDRLTGRTN